MRIAPGHPLLQAARRRGWQWIPGLPGEDGKPLVGMLARRGQVTILPHATGLRAQSVRWRAGEGPVWTVTNVYGAIPYDDSHALDTARLVRAGALETAAHGHGPGLIVGDFNLRMDALACQPTLVAAGWHDASDEASCIGTNARRATRIDHVLLNEAARELGARTSLTWDLGLPTHAAHWVELPPAELEMVPQWHAPPPFDKPAARGPDRAAAWATAQASWGQALEVAKATADPALHWKAIAGAAAAYHAARAAALQRRRKPRHCLRLWSTQTARRLAV